MSDGEQLSWFEPIEYRDCFDYLASEKFSERIKQSVGGDEYYTPLKCVNMIVPYIMKSGYKSIWCPFDTEESNFVKVFQKLGFQVNYGHIFTGQDFFDYKEPQADIVVSNPPFSKREDILRRLYQWDEPFALIMNFNGLFDSKKRHEMFQNHGVQMLVPKGRMKFVHNEKGELNAPNFQSVYVCHKLLDSQIVFDNSEF